MKELASALRAEVARAATFLGRIDEQEAMQPRGPDKWVRKEILGHLIDSAANNHQRFVRAQLADRYVGPGYDQEAWVATQHYRDRPWTELVELWVALNRHLAAVIEHVPAGKLPTPLVIGDGAPHALEWVMADYVRHLKHHLAQIGVAM